MLREDVYDEMVSRPVNAKAQHPRCGDLTMNRVDVGSLMFEE